VNDQFTLPPSYHSFVASGRYDGPDAPAGKSSRNFTSIQMVHTHTTLSQLAHTQPSHTELSHPICLPPSPFSLLPFPSCLHLSFATYWKKLTCGVIPSFIASPHHPIWPICPSRTDPGTSQQWRQRVLAEGSPRGLLP
jgi:hypothetical protein